jgi:hypothetical protein
MEIGKSGSLPYQTCRLFKILCFENRIPVVSSYAFSLRKNVKTVAKYIALQHLPWDALPSHNRLTGNLFLFYLAGSVIPYSSM